MNERSLPSTYLPSELRIFILRVEKLESSLRIPSCSQSFQIRDSEYLKEFSPAGLVSPEISEWLALPPTADTARQERHATATTTHPTRPTARPSRAAHVSRTRTSHQRPSRHRAWRAAPRSARQLDSRSLAGFEQVGARGKL